MQKAPLTRRDASQAMLRRPLPAGAGRGVGSLLLAGSDLKQEAKLPASIRFTNTQAQNTSPRSCGERSPKRAKLAKAGEGSYSFLSTTISLSTQQRKE